MNDLTSLGLDSFQWPSPAWLFGSLVFSVIGYGAFRYGRKTDRPPTLWIGVALMLYPYVVSNTALLYVVGGALCVGLWVVR